MGLHQKLLFWQFDNDSTSLTYCYFDSPNQGFGALETSGANTTVTKVSTDTDSSHQPFNPMVALGTTGHMIMFEYPELTFLTRKVNTVSSGTSIVVDSAVTLVACSSWHWRKLNKGTAITDGWVKIDYLKKKTLFIDLKTVSAGGGIDIQVEGRGSGVAGQGGDKKVIIVPLTNYAAATSVAYPIQEDVTWLRVGVCGHTDFSGTDDVTIYVEGDTAW